MGSPALANPADSRVATRWLPRLIDVQPHERSGLLYSFAAAMLLFTAYAILRPVRDAMGVTSGLASLPALFWASFGVMLVLQPIYGWLLSRIPRTVLLPRLYQFFALSLIGFYAWFLLQSDHLWIARAYFVWISVFNLYIVAMFWSLMADVFNRDQAGRMFGFIAAGLSIGGLLGPLLAGLLAKPLGSIHLLLVAAGLLLFAGWAVRRVIDWQQDHAAIASALENNATPLHGGAFAAFAQVARVPYLRGVALFVLLLTSASTVLYVEQQRVIGDAISDPDARTALFAQLDFAVQALSLLAQMLLFSRLLKRFGFTAMLLAVPLLLLIGFAAISLGSSLQVVLGAMLLRRVGEFAITRPCRDLLMSVVSREQKYQAKSLIDTFVYRGGDALSASALAALVSMSSNPGAVTPLAGMAVCAAWGGCAWWLGRRFEYHASAQASAIAAAAHQAVSTRQPRAHTVTATQPTPAEA